MNSVSAVVARRHLCGGPGYLDGNFGE